MSQNEYVLTGCAVDAVRGAAEERLLEGLKRGDSEAFDQLYAEFHGLVFNLAYRILADRDEASDLVQEVYLSIFRHVRSFGGESSLKTWIYRITVNACLNRNRWWQRRIKQSLVSLSEVQQSREWLDGQELKAVAASPELLAYQNELETRIQKGLRKLPADQKVAVVLRDLEGLSYEEIAETLGISLGTVKSRISRGRELLRDALTGIL